MKLNPVSNPTLSALRHPVFLKYWLGSFTSVGATQLQVMGLGWLVYELSNSTLELGYLGAAAGFPAIATSLFGGVLADRFDKRILLIVTSLITAALLTLLAVLDLAGVITVWQVIVIAACISLVTGFDWPARQAIFPHLIDREDMMSAVALTSVIWQACRMVMPAFGGLVIALSDTWVLFAFCAAGFFVMFIVMLTLEIRPSKSVQPANRRSTLHQINEGVQFILRDPTFFALITLSYAIFFFASTHMQLMPAFATLLGADEVGYGYLISMTGIGSVVGTVISGYLQQSRRLGLAMLLSAAISCIFLYAFAAITASNSHGHIEGGFVLALCMLFSAHIFSSVFMITSTTILQLEVPDQLRGRVMGFHAITYNLMPLGGLFAGSIAAVSSTPIAISVGITIFLCYLVWIVRSHPGIKQIDGAQLTEQRTQEV